jgi:hypothetical protein
MDSMVKLVILKMQDGGKAVKVAIKEDGAREAREEAKEEAKVDGDSLNSLNKEDGDSLNSLNKEDGGKAVKVAIKEDGARAAREEAKEEAKEDGVNSQLKEDGEETADGDCMSFIPFIKLLLNSVYNLIIFCH